MKESNVSLIVASLIVAPSLPWWVSTPASLFYVILACLQAVKE